MGSHRRCQRPFVISRLYAGMFCIESHHDYTYMKRNYGSTQIWIPSSSSCATTRACTLLRSILHPGLISGICCLYGPPCLGIRINAPANSQLAGKTVIGRRFHPSDH